MKTLGRSGWTLAAVAVFYLVGAVGHLVPVLLPLLLVMTPWFLWAAGAGIVFSAVAKPELGSAALWFGSVFLVTFALEAVGVATGQIFGAYHYSTVLGGLLWGVPPVIGWNWVLVVWGTYSASAILLPRWPEAARVAVSAMACVAFDLLLEPVAINLGYWEWHEGAVPWRNYAAWGIIAAAASWWAGRFPRLSVSPALAAYVAVQALFFAVLGLAGVHR